MSAILDAVRESYYDLYEAGLVTEEQMERFDKEFMNEEEWVI